MILKETFILARPREDVWNFFMDIPQVSTCVPGAAGIEEVGEQTYSGSLNVRVGPISASFDGQVTITGLEPPARITAKIDGKDKRTASLIGGTFTADLEEADSGDTRVNYQIDVVVRGRLAQFGSTVMQATAKEMTAAFVECVQQRFDNATGDPSTSSGEPSSPAATRTTLPAAQPPSLLTVILRALARAIRDTLRRLGPGVKRSAE